MSITQTIILLRTTRVSERDRRFAADLAAVSGMTVAYLADGRTAPVPPQDRPVVVLDDAGVSSLKLHMPHDYAWRCGDYGLYLARRQFPGARWVWMIENDVRFTGGSATTFFNAMSSSDADLLVSYFAPAGPDWYWHQRARGMATRPHRCFFPVVRMSASLVDALADKRRAHARRWARRILWPNDEAFVATTAVAAGYRVVDLNDVDGPWYERSSFSYDTTIDGDHLPDTGGPRLLHSVRYGSDIHRRVTYAADPEAGALYERKVKLARRLVRLLPW